ncbi:hypothetical protein ACQEVX_31475 [Streptomyces syringium]|uniref:hypothetical protein n=1 Tax=Streptomyces syringium TaxID=76729 RepID=UPI003D9205D3
MRIERLGGAATGEGGSQAATALRLAALVLPGLEGGPAAAAGEGEGGGGAAGRGEEAAAVETGGVEAGVVVHGCSLW